MTCVGRCQPSARAGAVVRNVSLQASGRLVLFLRDINLPKADKYGTSQVMAFLQQLLTYSGFYNKLEFLGKPATTEEEIIASRQAKRFACP